MPLSLLGLDDLLASTGDDGTLLVVLAVALLLGLRHATDPDHLAAVTTLIAGGRGDGIRRAGAVGASWGAGHATTLVVCGLPVVLAAAFLPDAVQRGAEVVVGVVIVGLALRVLAGRRHARLRSPLQAYGIGLVHGVGGSAGVAVLLLASIRDDALAVAALLLFAAGSAVSMWAASLAFGVALTRGPVAGRLGAVTPALAALSLGFGVWYTLGALEVVASAP